MESAKELRRGQDNSTTAHLTTSKAWTVNAYVAAGFPLFPCIGNTKTPAVKVWQNTKIDPVIDAEDFPGNFGVVLQAEHLVIDVDPRRFPEGVNVIAELWGDLGLSGKPKTLVVQTGGKQPGLHMYFKKPADWPCRETMSAYPGLEFKSKGRYVIGAGSIHPDTEREYKVLSGTPKEVADAPQVLLDLLWRDETFGDEEGLAEAKDDEGTKKRYIAFLKHKEGAVEGADGEPFTLKVAMEGKDYGLSADITHQLMLDHWNDKCSPPWDADELRVKVRNAYAYGKRPQGVHHPEKDFEGVALPEDEDEAERHPDIKWDNDKTGKPKPTLANCMMYFRLKDYKSYKNALLKLIRYNEFADNIEFTRRAPWHKLAQRFWTDTDTIMLKYWLSHHKHFNAATMTFHEAVVAVSQDYSYHPVKEYLESLEWDGIPRLDMLLPEYAGCADSPYTRAVGKNTLIAAIARIYDPGCQFDHILILEGRQGTGKSSFVRILGGEHYADINIDPHNKDTIDAMQGHWIIEASEMEFTRRADIQAIKAFITKVSDRIRPAYARTTRTFFRQCIFIGTINPEVAGGYLRDTTGNRRFWPVATGRINLRKLAEDRDQLFAEAYQRYRAGEKHYLDDERLVKLAEVEQRARTVADAWQEIIEDWIHMATAADSLPPIMTAAQVAQDALNLTARQVDRNALVRISHCMTEIGWERKKLWVPSLNRTAWAFRNVVESDPLGGL